MSDPKTLGQRLRALRLARKVKPGKLARKAGLSRSMLWLIEEGRRSPSIDSLTRIADALGVTAAELLEGGSDVAA